MSRLPANSRARKKELQELARAHRNNSTQGEIIMWKLLRANRLGASFRRQYVVGDFILDFYSPSIQLAIEVDGEQHSLEEDEVRDAFLEKLGIQVLRVPSLTLFPPHLTSDMDTILYEAISKRQAKGSTVMKDEKVG